ncbi:hypothetical protein SD77_3618 [Bacillus badius]|uniref:Uncharacterized protein n=1 Tax=Bacillus badius TaxID=1455 RepID=A0ABR5AVQ5_BACBA|nr:hypothetical protein SD77_3618 [Bacillus badius]
MFDFKFFNKKHGTGKRTYIVILLFVFMGQKLGLLASFLSLESGNSLVTK